MRADQNIIQLWNNLIDIVHYPGLKTVIEDEEDLIRHSKQNKAIIFAFNPHDLVRYIVWFVISSSSELIWTYDISISL